MDATMLIQITNSRAVGLIHELEELNLIKVLKEYHGNQQQPTKLSEKYAGKLPTEVAEELQQYVTQSRNEWNKRST